VGASAGLTGGERADGIVGSLFPDCSAMSRMLQSYFHLRRNNRSTIKNQNTASDEKMGCLPSTEVDPEGKEAGKRNARIDRQIRNDKKRLDRTVKILLLGEL
jgi:hypothetical protein